MTVLRGRVLTAAVLALVLGVAACSAGDKPAAEPTAPSAPASSAPALTTEVRMGVVTGRLPEQRRGQLKRQVRRVVDRWLAAAYVGGDYPRRDFEGAFPGFTRDAARQAARDRVMSNRKVGGRVDAVAALRSRVLVDVLAVRRRAAGITARFSLTMRLSGKVRRTDRVGGRLFLTWTHRRWKAFGYDVNRGRA